MKYTNVNIAAFGYELAPVVVSSSELEKRLEPVYRKLHFQRGQLEALTGIYERRFWPVKHTMHAEAAKAAQKALTKSNIPIDDIGMVIYGGVCRDNLEPATACAVADKIGASANAIVFDISNACLGVLSGMIQVANAIELGQIKAGIVVSCESSRQIVDTTIERLLKNPDMEMFKQTIATMTGGSGAIAVVLTAKDLSDSGHTLLGGAIKNSVENHKLCTWGPDTGIPASGLNIMQTDSIGVLNNGVLLGKTTYEAFKKELSMPENKPDKVICHQVGSAHQKTILETLNIPIEKDYTTFQYLGNIGTVSLPITAAIAGERDYIQKNDIVGFFGIGSGLNCMMLGIEW